MAAPLRLTKLPETSLEALSDEERIEFLRREVLPHLQKLIRKEIEVGLSDSRDAGLARRSLIDRTLGKPTETKKTESKSNIIFTIKSYEDERERLELTVNVEQPIESEYKILSESKSSGGLDSNHPTPQPLSLDPPRIADSSKS